MRSPVRAGPVNPDSGVTWIGRNNDAGVHVNHHIAFMQAAVWACIDVVSSSLASSDWNVYLGVRGGDKKTALPEAHEEPDRRR